MALNAGSERAAPAPRATATSSRMRRLILIYLTISIRGLAKAAASISGHN